MTLSRERKRAAMHEAGHAVFCIVYGFPFHHVEIHVKETDAGQVLGGGVAGAGVGMTESHWRTALMCGVAGEQVNRKNARLTVVDILRTGNGDFNKLVDSLSALGLDTKSKSCDRYYINPIFKEAHDVVVEHRTLHALLTDALLERGRLTWGQCLCLALRAQCTPFQESLSP